MKFSVDRNHLIAALQMLCGIVDRKSTKPILSNVRFDLMKEFILLTASDVDVELKCSIEFKSAMVEKNSITVSAHKLFDICRSLPENFDVHFEWVDNQMLVSCDQSRFVLATLPADEFPVFQPSEKKVNVSLFQADLKKLIVRTSFAMAQQDVRFYLNGLLVELKERCIRSVATDGHRLSMATHSFDEWAWKDEQQVIIPRKAVMELQRLLVVQKVSVELQLGEKHLCVLTPNYQFMCRLVDAKFPDYQQVIPKSFDTEFVVEHERLKSALSRVAILSNEKHKSVTFFLTKGKLSLSSNNAEREEAQEDLAVDFSGESEKVSFNVAYLLEALSFIEQEMVYFSLSTEKKIASLYSPDDTSFRHIVMPVRL